MVLRHLTLAVALLLAAGCGSNQDMPSDAEETAYAESGPAVGEPVEFFVYTHCGVESLRLDGRWWHAVEPLYGEDGPGTSPQGWSNPYQKGELTLNSKERVTFEAHGTQVPFVPAADNRPLRVCA